MKTIKARGIERPADRPPKYPGDAPQGCVFVYRYGDGGRQYKIGDPWPDFEPGEQVEIETNNHYTWIGTVEERIDEDTIVFRPSRKESTMPLPPVVEGQPYVLPYWSGDAWSTRPEAGQVLLIEGNKPYRVMGKPKPDKRRSGYVYELKPVAPADYAKRPGRTLIKDLIDPNSSSDAYFGHNVGRIVEIGGEFLHIQKVERQGFGDGEGTIFGYNTYGAGHFVPAARAAKLRAAWEAKEKVRSIELSLRVAKQSFDYGGRPEAVPRLEAALAEARKAAGVLG